MSRPAFALAVAAACVVATLIVHAMLSVRLSPDVAPAGVEMAPPAPTAGHTEATSPESSSSEAALPPVTRESATRASSFSEADMKVAATMLRSALVNIICIAPRDTRIPSISASGVIVSSSGFILTDAHVAAYFLLADSGVSCVIRTGDPATAAYRATLAYIPAAWVRSNESLLSAAAPSGTGERDFGFLAITGSADNGPLPALFPSVSLGRADAVVGSEAVIGSYGAQSLPLSFIESKLSPTIVRASVHNLFTFGTSTPDVLDLGGSAAAQEGSSGGGVLGPGPSLAGIVTTSTLTGAFASRSLSAISISYIRREYENETGEALDEFLARRPEDVTAAFASNVPGLEHLLLNAL